MFKVLTQRFASRRSDVYGSSGMMLTTARRRHYRQNFVYVMPLREFLLYQLELPVKATITRYHDKDDALLIGYLSHTAPLLGRGRDQEVLASAPTDVGDSQICCIRKKR